jgi:hypothetical protein
MQKSFTDILSVIILCVIMLSGIMLSGIMLSGIMLSVIMLSVILVNVAAPFRKLTLDRREYDPSSEKSLMARFAEFGRSGPNVIKLFTSVIYGFPC